MKIRNSIIAVMLIAAVSMAACSKEDKVNTANYAENGVKSDVSLPIYLNGTLVESLSQMDSSDYVSVSTDTACYYFDSELSFQNFCVANNLSDLYASNQTMDDLYQKAVELGIQNSEEIPDEMNEYFNKLTGRTLTQDDKFFLGCVYDGQTYTGTSALMGMDWPTLGKLNKKVSSFKLYNIVSFCGLWFCHKTWWGKPRDFYFVVGTPGMVTGYPYLYPSQDNKYCSYFTLGR